MKSKRINLILLMIIASFMLINTSYAAEETNEKCETYTNHYFFFNVLREELYNANIQKEPYWEIVNETTFSQLHKLTNKQKIKNIQNSEICIIRNNGDECSTKYYNTNINGTMTIEEFWTKYIETLENHIKEDYTLDEYENTSAYILTEGNQKYIIHQNYKKIEGEDNDTAVHKSDPLKYNFTKNNIPNLVKASAIPSELIINTNNIEQNKPFKVNITRHLTKEPHNTNLEAFPLTYDTSTTTEPYYFSPAMHKITYEVCNEPYNATISYVNKETGEELKPPYKAQKQPGEGETVKSPEVDHCTTKETSITYKIDETNPEDFEKVVPYTCTSPKEGSAFVYGVVILTIISLVSIIYFNKRNKTNEI